MLRYRATAILSRPMVILMLLFWHAKLQKSMPTLAMCSGDAGLISSVAVLFLSPVYIAMICHACTERTTHKQIMYLSSKYLVQTIIVTSFCTKGSCFAILQECGYYLSLRRYMGRLIETVC